MGVIYSYTILDFITCLKSVQEHQLRHPRARMGCTKLGLVVELDLVQANLRP